ncbi:MAG: serine O-acetyltransferase EpsC [Planctomycetota bacterium]|jgi:serine O-acetyltransferase
MSSEIIESVVKDLSRPESYGSLVHRGNSEMPMPSGDALRKIMETLRAVLFPGYFGPSELGPGNMSYYLGSFLDTADRLLREQILRGYGLVCDTGKKKCPDCEASAAGATDDLIRSLPEVRRALATDVRAAFEGDPAAKNPGETIFCYPSLQAMTHYRIAHVLYGGGVPLIPRIITEMAHGATGIDIHPGARIGDHFFMDHGTGIVIGETCEIGARVRVYQGVTLGAKSFALDRDGNPVKGIARHPIVEDDVIIYSGATILGRVRIGRGSVIGGNVWLTRDVPAGSRVLQGKHEEVFLGDGGGI